MRLSETAFAVKVRSDVPERTPLTAISPDDEVAEPFDEATETFPVKIWQPDVETQDGRMIFAAEIFIAIS